MFPWKLQRVSGSEGYAGRSPSESASSTASLAGSHHVHANDNPGVTTETCPSKTPGEANGALAQHKLPCGHWISQQALCAILKEPLPAHRQCPHRHCTAVLASCRVVDYPADHGSVPLASHPSFSFSSGPHTAAAAHTSVTSITSTTSGGSDALDPASHWVALQRVDSGGKQPSLQLTTDTEEPVQGAECSPIRTSTPSNAAAVNCSSTCSERTFSGSLLQYDSRSARGKPFASVRRTHAPSREPSGDTPALPPTDNTARRHYQTQQSKTEPLAGFNSVPGAKMTSCSQSSSRHMRRAISLEQRTTAKPASTRNNVASLLLSQPSAVVITVVDCNKQKLRILLHGPNLTVEDVKRQIQEQMGNPVREQRLKYKGMLLSNAHKLVSYGIEQKAQLQLDAASFRATF